LDSLTQGWGAKVIDRLAADLRSAFPEMRGFSARNLKYMRAFAEAWPEESIVQQLAAQIPWFHNCTLLNKVSEPSARAWYVQQTIEHGWSRHVLVHQIESRLYQRQGKALTNFQRTLPKPQSDLAQQLLKDPYHFDFLQLSSDTQERVLERALLAHIQKFLLELGTGFALVGNQYHLEIGDKDYYLDLLFYHLKLRCYVAIELKVGEFKPEYAGKMNFYLAAVDDLLAHQDDAPSIGLILCKEKDHITVEYALRYSQKPIGVADYELTSQLPENLQANLPTAEQLEMGLQATTQENPKE
jgi:predicted nuclease of restriction endonuclease-like (RecB) superfamily